MMSLFGLEMADALGDRLPHVKAKYAPVTTTPEATCDSSAPTSAPTTQANKADVRTARIAERLVVNGYKRACARDFESDFYRSLKAA